MRLNRGVLLAAMVAAAGCGGGGGSTMTGDAAAGDAPTGAGDGAADATPAMTGPLVGNQITLRVRTYTGQPQRAAFVNVPYLRGDTRARLVNVVADLNGDGAIAAYAAGAAMQEEWVVQNVAIVPALTRYGHYFALEDAAIVAGKNVKVRVVLGDSAATAAPALGGPASDQAAEAMAAVTVREGKVLVSPGPGNVGQGAGSGEPYDQWLGETLGTTEVPGGLYQSGFPATPQYPNACVLNSIANSLSWLSRKYKFAGCISGMDEFGSMYGVDSSEQLQTLSLHLNTVGAFGYTQELATPPEKILPGKNKVVSDWDLPITTTVVTASDPQNQQNIFDAIKDAVRKGCAVEVIVVGGGLQHMVNAVGFFDGDLGKSVTIHNGETSAESFGDAYSVKTTGNSAELGNFPINGKATKVSIASAMIECPTATPISAVVLDYDHGPFKAGQKIDLRCVTNGHVSMPDACACNHYHDDNVSISHGASMSGPIPDNAKMKCGHGCVGLFKLEELDAVCCRKKI